VLRRAIRPYRRRSFRASVILSDHSSRMLLLLLLLQLLLQ